jgi:hypothetical protein
MNTASDGRTVERRLSNDGLRWIIVERWFDQQVSPPRWRSKNRHVLLSKADLAYHECRKTA